MVLSLSSPETCWCSIIALINQPIVDVKFTNIHLALLELKRIYYRDRDPVTLTGGFGIAPFATHAPMGCGHQINRRGPRYPEYPSEEELKYGHRLIGWT